ncbi:MAG TPA: translation elongation factor Ts [Balneolales bacterium]|nr:translation elongation factor Ts [Balneolales bacterium]
MSISAADVKALRDRTGAGMMDCKKALNEANGDMDAAIEILRKKGQKVSEKRADREANQGIIVTHINEEGNKAVALALNCETDFVARNDEFIQAANNFAKLAFEKNITDSEAIKNESLNGKTVAEYLKELVGKIGEKIEISRIELIDSDGSILSYIHPGNQLAVLVEFDGKLEDEEIGKNVAMQVAAMNPIAVTKDDVDSSVVEKELEIAKQQLLNEGKPEHIAEKASQGKLRRFYEERVLLNQKYVKDSGLTVKQYLEQNGAPNVVTFKRLQLGETA